MFIPTSRLLVIALFGTVLIVLLPTHDLALVVAAIWLAVVAILAVIDGRLVPSRDELQWARLHEPKLSLGRWNSVEIRLSSRAAGSVELRVRDAPPPELVPHGNVAQGTCWARDAWEATYRVFPVRRGEYRFGPITARFLGPFGLVWRQYSEELQDTVKVFPDLLSIGTYKSLVRRGQLEEIGLHTTRRWGTGTEFERLRDYGPDDEFRRINWAATARRHKPIAVDYETERSQNIVLVLDAGRVMSLQVPLPQRPVSIERTEDETSQPDLTRLDYAVNTSLLLAFVAQRHGDRVGLLAFSDSPLRYAAPRPGRSQFLALTEALYDLQAEPVEADYACGLAYLASRQSRRSLVVIFTDLAEPEAVSPLVSHAAHLSRRHLVMVVTLRDPGVERLAALIPNSSTNVYQRAVAHTLLEDREGIVRELRRRGVLTVDVSADQLSPSVINRYLEVKARGRL